ncbi:MAG TPA: hypothetical protein VM933_08500, partial [Acidimicrobiales bacterium]|nr:hypothetical protein [Acidimicrobiales bacterium]
ESTGAMRSVKVHRPSGSVDLHRTSGGGAGGGRGWRDGLQRAMTEGAGVVRSAASLAATAELVAGLDVPDDDPELRNLVTVALGLLASATAREESRGAHSRTDFPQASPAFERRLVLP